MLVLAMGFTHRMCDVKQVIRAAPSWPLTSGKSKSITLHDAIADERALWFVCRPTESESEQIISLGNTQTFQACVLEHLNCLWKPKKISLNDYLSFSGVRLLQVHDIPP